MLYEGCILKTTQLHSFLTILSILVSRQVRYVCMHIKSGVLWYFHIFSWNGLTRFIIIFFYSLELTTFLFPHVSKSTNKNFFISYFIYFFMRIRHKIGSALGAELKVSKGFKELKRVRKMPRSAVV